jgi:hypothetical protein
MDMDSFYSVFFDLQHFSNTRLHSPALNLEVALRPELSDGARSIWEMRKCAEASPSDRCFSMHLTALLFSSFARRYVVGAGRAVSAFPWIGFCRIAPPSPPLLP